MSKIIKFPTGGPVHPVPDAAIPAQSKSDPNPKGKAFLAGILRFVWVVTVLFWPVLKWIVSLDVLFQAVRMVYYWNTPGIYAGWTFLFHFGVLTALTYYVSIYQPKGI